MPSIRLFVEDDLAEGNVIGLERAQSHYLTHVMRQKTGDELRLFNGRDGEWRCEIDGTGRGWCSVSIKEQTRDVTTGPDIWLLFAPVKRARIDFIAAKATELGVAVLQPVFTDHTAVSRVNTERLRANAVEAAEQCGALSVPEVRGALTLSDMLAGWPADRKLIVCDETGDAEPILEALAREKDVIAWAILIGPEGGFSASELDRIRQSSNFIPVSLGPRILRADTAAIAALTCWQAVLGDWAAGR